MYLAIRLSSGRGTPSAAGARLGLQSGYRAEESANLQGPRGGHMKRLVVGVIAAAVLVSMARTAGAQSKTVTSEMKTQTGTVEAIDPDRRMVTLKKEDGTFVTVVAGPDITRFSEVKVGDKVTARYYENLVIRLKRPGESEVDSKIKSTTPSEQTLPGGTKATQRTITATITAIDPATPSITFNGPNGWTYTSKVQDPATLASVKVGDKVDIVWTEALLVGLER
jgi:Cu/Ag efflux protein CusF